ncbi:M15 family metallopeptidase [Anaerocolumna xylanovorans]|uniref:D-alanyl-D-alanine carboxypeptidase n=1 Tax=Anaerocolumna xylanovorans DSM 12503 TaxID=1121345 RepID=A0A1M7YMH6_9FIRM|nr:M15 family metallopeptidase [Anaerocolumna xylanovorans]SHO53839.1 D-alanyl-D-alanine carboxypeptidase [Anaerocolumna xylanovorans DSM 12503]
MLSETPFKLKPIRGWTSYIFIILFLALFLILGIKTYAKSGTDASVLLNRKSLDALTAGTVITPSKVEGGLNACFYGTKINTVIKKRITGKSYKENDKITLSDLRYIRVLYYGFDKKTHIGELIVNKKIAKDVSSIFKDLYKAKYPIGKMVLIDEYNADDEASMKDNNTSAFNYRTIAGSDTLSKHAMGLAIDVNPLYNPCVEKINGKAVVSPAEGKKYANRSLQNAYYIRKKDVCYQSFIKRGFTWGGSWSSLKDYQHFQKSVK